MKYTTNKSINSVNIKIALQTGSPFHPDINQRLICQKDLNQVDPVPEVDIPDPGLYWPKSRLPNSEEEKFS